MRWFFTFSISNTNLHECDNLFSSYPEMLTKFSECDNQVDWRGLVVNDKLWNQFFLLVSHLRHDELYTFHRALLSLKSSIFLHVAAHSMLSTSLILTVYRTHDIMSQKNGLPMLTVRGSTLWL